jgi:hypothetical protein
MALTTSSFQDNNQPRNPQAADDAARVYGAPGDLPDATRMHREAGIAAVASDYTSTPTAESSYADGAFTLGKATLTAHKQAGASVPLTKGLPGDPSWPPSAA